MTIAVSALFRLLELGVAQMVVHLGFQHGLEQNLSEGTAEFGDISLGFNVFGGLVAGQSLYFFFLHCLPILTHRMC